MAHAQVGAGSAYVYTAVDSNNDVLDGGKSYTLTLPPNPPAKNFWAVDIYDTQTRSLLQTDNPYPSVMSLGDTVVANDDGSYTHLVRTRMRQWHTNRTGSKQCRVKDGSRCSASTVRSNHGSTRRGSRRRLCRSTGADVLPVRPADDRHGRPRKCHRRHPVVVPTALRRLPCVANRKWLHGDV